VIKEVGVHGLKLVVGGSKVGGSHRPLRTRIQICCSQGAPFRLGLGGHLRLGLGRRPKGLSVSANTCVFTAAVP
jgi:hypothetical protein